MSIPRSTAWSFGPPMRSVPNLSSGMCWIYSCSFIHLKYLWLCKFSASFIYFWIILVGIFFGLTCWRYYLRKLKKVKKSNGQVLAINEVIFLHLLVLYCVSLFQFDWHKDAISFEICIDNDRFNSGAKQVSWTFNVKFMWSKLIKIKCECTLIRDLSSL